MATPTTVMEFRTSDKQRRDDGVAALQTSLGTTDAVLTGLRVGVATATDALAAIHAAEAKIRLDMANAVTPAEAAALVLALEANLMKQRVASATLAAKQDALTAAEQARSRIDALLAVERARLAQAGADLALAKASGEQNDIWKAALKGAALTVTLAEAKKAATTSLVAAARSRLETLLGGAGVLELLSKRYVDAASAVGLASADAGRLIDALDALATARAPVDGKVLGTATAYGRAREAVRDVVETAVQQFAWASSALQAAGAAPNLPPEDQGAVDTRAGAGAEGATKESAVHAARAKERANLAALDAVALAKEAADPTFKRDTIAPQFKDWDDAVKARQAAEALLTADMKKALDTWEAAVPPPLMTTVVAYLRAEAAVERVKSIDTAKLDTDLTAAESAYAGALDARATADQLAEAAGQKVAARLDDASAAAKVNDLRLAALVRGDG